MHIIESHLFDFVNSFFKKSEFPTISKNIDLNYYDIKINNLPDNFNKFKIMHISDLHGVNFLDYYPQILTRIKKEKPNILILSGDISHNDYYIKSIELLDQLQHVIPYQNMFVTTGNHEFLSCKHHKVVNINDIRQELSSRNVNFMRNKVLHYQIDKQKISIIGIDDPWNCKNESNYIYWQLQKLSQDIPKNRVKILISHRPEFLNLYSKYNMDLVFSGHTHGGQIFLPLINRGLYAPHQGFLSKHAKGHFTKDNTQIIISAGMGNETRVPRINNPGDINFITLKQN